MGVRSDGNRGANDAGRRPVYAEVVPRNSPGCSKIRCRSRPPGTFVVEYKLLGGGRAMRSRLRKKPVVQNRVPNQIAVAAADAVVTHDIVP